MDKNARTIHPVIFQAGKVRSVRGHRRFVNQPEQKIRKKIPRTGVTSCTGLRVALRTIEYSVIVTEGVSGTDSGDGVRIVVAEVLKTSPDPEEYPAEGNV
jgi:hypothetical protein